MSETFHELGKDFAETYAVFDKVAEFRATAPEVAQEAAISIFRNLNSKEQRAVQQQARHSATPADPYAIGPAVSITLGKLAEETRAA